MAALVASTALLAQDSTHVFSVGVSYSSTTAEKAFLSADIWQLRLGAIVDKTTVELISDRYTFNNQSAQSVGIDGYHAFKKGYGHVHLATSPDMRLPSFSWAADYYYPLDHLELVAGVRQMTFADGAQPTFYRLGLSTYLKRITLHYQYNVITTDASYHLAYIRYDFNPNFYGKINYSYGTEFLPGTGEAPIEVNSEGLSCALHLTLKDAFNLQLGTTYRVIHQSQERTYQTMISIGLTYKWQVIK